jgi:Predicted integral membrane protein (DUF2269)
MIDVALLKWTHIVSFTVLFGTGLGTAFHGLASNLRGDLPPSSLETGKSCSPTGCSRRRR